MLSVVPPSPEEEVVLSTCGLGEDVEASGSPHERDTLAGTDDILSRT